VQRRPDRRVLARRHRRLAPHHHEALDRGEPAEHDHHPQHRRQHVEREADAEQDEPLGALHQPAARAVPEALGLGALVGDEHREPGRGEGEDRELRAAVRQVPRDAAEEDDVRDAVGDRVEERAARTGAAAVARDGAVEDVRDAGREQADETPDQVAVRDEDRGADRAREPDGRQPVGRHARPDERATDGLERPFDLRAPADVEHRVAPESGDLTEPRAPAGALAEVRNPRYHRGADHLRGPRHRVDRPAYTRRSASPRVNPGGRP
jgi:hypothetical protein